MDNKRLKHFAPVSVIIPCYCCHKTLERASQSALNQTLLPSQIILVEDASPDDGKTREKVEVIARQIAGFSDIECTTIFLDVNRGPGEARNWGWEVAKHEFIAFLDADDAWHPSKIEVQYAWMRSNPTVDLTCHHSVFLDQYCTALSLNPQSIELTLFRMLYRNQIQTRTVMLRRSLSNRFLEGQRFCEDYRLWMDMIVDSRRIILLNAQLASSYRPEYSQGGQSSMLWKMEISELRIYRDLHSNHKISIFLWGSCSLFSMTKFVIRFAKSNFRYLLFSV